MWPAPSAILPVYADADQDERGEEQAERSEKGQNSAGAIAGSPLHRRSPSDLDRHQQQRNLSKKIANKFERDKGYYA